MTNYEAEARPRRFTDQRGIALQTVIIMVVLLAIAGGVAAVLFSRGQSATQQLESQNIVSAAASEYTSETLCNSVTGLTYDSGTCKYETGTSCQQAGGVKASANTVPGADANDCVTQNTAQGKYLGDIKTPGS